MTAWVTKEKSLRDDVFQSRKSKTFKFCWLKSIFINKFIKLSCCFGFCLVLFLVKLRFYFNRKFSSNDWIEHSDCDFFSLSSYSVFIVCIEMIDKEGLKAREYRRYNICFICFSSCFFFVCSRFNGRKHTTLIYRNHELCCLFLINIIFFSWILYYLIFFLDLSYFFVLKLN